MSLRFAAGLLHCCLLLEPSLAVGGEAPAPEEKPAPHTDRYGDPLPEGAIARLGTEGFRHDSQVTSIAYSPGT